MQNFSLLIFGCMISTRVTSLPEELKLIQVLFRHGDKSPDPKSRSFYPLDLYTNETWYPEGWGGLTNSGKRNVYQLGLFLKERYGKWLGNIYLKDNVAFRSSSNERTIMSTQIVAAALFPPAEIQRWDARFDWQPIPVFSDPSELKSFYLPSYLCKKFLAMRYELQKTDPALIRLAEEWKGVYEFVSRNVGHEVGYDHIPYIYQHLYGLMNENVELPEWTKDIFPEGKLEEISAYDYVIQSYNKSLIKLNGGLWIREWLHNVDLYLNSSRRGQDQRGFFYGGHESNLGGTLVALGVFEPHVPFYCSALMFELSEVEDKFYVKVFYRNRGVLQELLIPGCGGLNCPLETFRRLFADVITAEDEAAVCD